MTATNASNAFAACLQASFKHFPLSGRCIALMRRSAICVCSLRCATTCDARSDKHSLVLAASQADSATGAAAAKPPNLLLTHFGTQLPSSEVKPGSV
jgi:hypothetical protein